jgi:hypothetical protein
MGYGKADGKVEKRFRLHRIYTTYHSKASELDPLATASRKGIKVECSATKCRLISHFNGAQADDFKITN